MLINEEMDIFKVVKDNKLVKFITFECQLPYKLEIYADLYSTEIKFEDDRITLLKESKIFYIIEHKHIRNSKIPSKSHNYSINQNKEYEYFITKIKVIIKVDNDSEIEEIFDNQITYITQIIMDNLFVKYNESLAGNDFATLNLNELGYENLSYYKLENNQYELKKQKMSCSYNKKKVQYNHKKKDLESSLNEELCVWLYLFNKVKFLYNQNQNLEAIIFSAITVESYIHNLIKINNKEEELENFIETNQITNISLFQLIKFLHSEKIITKKQKEDLKSLFGEIRGMRNKIIHGKISEIILNDKLATKIIDKMILYFENYEDIVDEYMGDINKNNPKLIYKYQPNMKADSVAMCNYFDYVRNDKEVKRGQFTVTGKNIALNFNNGDKSITTHNTANK